MEERISPCVRYHYILAATPSKLRMRRFFELTTALSLLLLCSAAADAQKTYALGIGAGPAIPVGRISRGQKSGYNATVSLAVGVAELPLGLRLDGVFQQFQGRANTSTQTSVSSGRAFRAMGAIVNLIYAFPGTTAKPYIIAGAGLYNTRSVAPGSTSANDWGFNGGVGATFGFGPFASFIETRYHSISRSPQDGGVVHFVPVTIGILF